MLYGSGELRRANRLTDMVTAQLSGICLGSCARDLLLHDMKEPVLSGEIALGGRVHVTVVRNLLIARGFRPDGWSGAGRDRQPVYTRPD